MTAQPPSPALEQRYTHLPTRHKWRVVSQQGQQLRLEDLAGSQIPITFSDLANTEVWSRIV
ncbi:hypothetical protein C5U62_32145 [Pseudomonas protegens]|uniref:Uncharacterized protein n=1 Tax=Pseudomonas protegens TaxID=380021 RepID=A0A2T6GB51_9PSED|nr:hypothetical protein [Pseudomonas protegens]PUA41377.1 hypothetical protein C5U62_32145 [Pseudomonas protegens]